MDLILSPGHQMTQKIVRDFVQKGIAPVIKEHDRKQEPIPFTLKHMGEPGIFGLPFLLRVAMSEYTELSSVSIFQWGTEEQKFLVPLANGQKIGCDAFTESGVGSDVAAMRTPKPMRCEAPAYDEAFWQG